MRSRAGLPLLKRVINAQLNCIVHVKYNTIQYNIRLMQGNSSWHSRKWINSGFLERSQRLISKAAVSKSHWLKRRNRATGEEKSFWKMFQWNETESHIKANVKKERWFDSCKIRMRSNLSIGAGEGKSAKILESYQSTKLLECKNKHF